MRSLSLIPLIGIIAIQSGCAGLPCDKIQTHPNLLFDAVPGPFSAGQILHNSDWPSYPRSSILRQEVFFSERIIDVQYHNGSASQDRLYRRFDSLKIGHESR